MADETPAQKLCREARENVDRIMAQRDQLDQQVRELLSAYKVWKNATESRLKLLNGREALDTMIPADRALIEACERVRKERGDA